MENREWNEGAGDIWWREVAGPHKYIKKMARAILDRQCLVIDADLDDDVFRETLKDRISSYDCDCHYVRIAADDFTDLNTFTAFIAQKYAPQFRFDPLDETPLISLIRQPWLQHYVFFVDSLSGSCPWLEQAAAAVGSLAGREGSAWIFRAPSSVIALWDKMTGVCVLDQQHYLYHYDIQYFAMTCLQDTALNLYQRYYTADIIAKIAGTDGRLCLALARQELYSRPETVIQEQQLSVDLRPLLLETQMQHILPILEDVRRYLVQKYETMIEQILPQKDEYGKELERPTDLELRHLQHYLRGRGLFFHEKDDDWFQCAYQARNDISHLQVLPTDQLDKLFYIQQKIH